MLRMKVLRLAALATTGLLLSSGCSILDGGLTSLLPVGIGAAIIALLGQGT